MLKWLKTVFLISMFSYLNGMDSFDQLILDSLKDDSSKTFKEILAKGGLSHNTLKRYRKDLMDEGLVQRSEKAENRRGRPEYSYCLTPKLTQHINLTLKGRYTSLVTSTFTKLKQICRHSKDGFCRTKKRDCHPHICPYIIREE